MSTASQTTQTPQSTQIPIPVLLVWDPVTDNVIDIPPHNVGDLVRFSTQEGPLEIVFFSPFGDETIRLTDKDSRQFSIGGIYHFRCTVNGISRKGGVIDVVPHR